MIVAESTNASMTAPKTAKQVTVISRGGIVIDDVDSRFVNDDDGDENGRDDEEEVKENAMPCRTNRARTGVKRERTSKDAMKKRSHAT
jgi:hypothetical protein